MVGGINVSIFINDFQFCRSGKVNGVVDFCFGIALLEVLFLKRDLNPNLVEQKQLIFCALLFGAYIDKLQLDNFNLDF